MFHDICLSPSLVHFVDYFWGGLSFFQLLLRFQRDVIPFTPAEKRRTGGRDGATSTRRQRQAVLRPREVGRRSFLKIHFDISIHGGSAVEEQRNSMTHSFDRWHLDEWTGGGRLGDYTMISDLDNNGIYPDMTGREAVEASFRKA